ncbi:MAG: DUF1330 domain-containing protein [Azoarcus sp.]|nr:DUF1330 domain-containing protein [Azoarcus sp.]
MSEAYLIGYITIKDAEKWAEYKSHVPATLVPHGGEVVFRGTVDAVLAGSHPHTDAVVIRFPDRQSLHAWHDSAAYQALVPLRAEASDGTLIAYNT